MNFTTAVFLVYVQPLVQTLDGRQTRNIYVQEQPTLCYAKSERNNNKLGGPSIYTGARFVLWSPPSAVHKIDAISKGSPGLFISGRQICLGCSSLQTSICRLSYNQTHEGQLKLESLE